MKDDVILSLLSSTSLMLMQNIDISLDKCRIFTRLISIIELVNDAVIEFYELVDTHLNVQLTDFANNIIEFSTYMLIKLLYEVDVNVFIFDLLLKNKMII